MSDRREIDISEFPGGYTPVKRCGCGAYGVVWLVRDISGRLLVLKMVSRDEIGSAFQREFTGLSTYCSEDVRHENLIPVYHVGMEQSYFYYTMPVADNLAGSLEDYVPATLANMVRRKRFTIPEIIDIALKLLHGLKELHNHNMAHRDVKPDNILFIDGEPCLGDMGLVTHIGNRASLVGTYSYIPPELLQGRFNAEGYRAQHDLYAMGKVIYHMMTGLAAENFPLLRTEQNDDPETVRLLHLVNKICDVNPSWRMSDIDKVIETLEEYRDNPPPPGKRFPRRHFVVAAAVLTAAAACLGVALLRPERPAGKPPEPIPEVKPEPGPETKPAPVFVPPKRKFAPLKKYDSAIARQLLQAIHKNDYAALEKLLQEHDCANMELDQRSGKLPLYQAVSHRSVPAVIETLLAYGASPGMRDRRGASPIGVALYSNAPASVWRPFLPYLESLNLPVSANDETMLHAAVGSKNIESLKYLLKQGADPNVRDKYGNTPLFKAVRHDYQEMSQILIDSGAAVEAVNNYGDTLLHVLPPDGTLARKILSLNIIDVKTKNKFGDTALLTAVQSKAGASIIRLLLKAGISPDEPNRKGRRPIHEAASYGDVEMLEILLQAGAGTGLRDGRGFSAVHWAAIYNRPEVLKRLLKAGVPLNQPDAAGRTPIHWAAMRGHATIAEILLNAGADFHLKDKWGKTPAELADMFRHARTYELLSPERPDLTNARPPAFLQRFFPIPGKPLTGEEMEELRQLITSKTPRPADRLNILISRFAAGNPPDRLKWELMAFALGNNNLGALNVMLARRISPNITDVRGNTLLIEAVRRNNLKAVELLCHYDINVAARNAEGKNAAVYAAAGGHAQILRVLIRSTFHPDDSRARQELADAALAAGHAACAEVADTFDPLTGMCCREEFLNVMTINNDVPGTRNYLALGLQGINGMRAPYYAPLGQAVWSTQEDMTRVLLESGAWTEMQNQDGHSALMAAVQGSNYTLLKLLLDYGADPLHMAEDNTTALSLARKMNASGMIELLGFYGGPDIKNR